MAGRPEVQTDRPSDERPGGNDAKKPDGFREQPLALKILLLASVAAITIGVVRCSFELTAPPPDIETVGVSVSAASAVGGGVESAIAERFAAELASRDSLEARVVEEGERGFDALVVLRAEIHDGMLTVVAELSDTRTGRYLGSAEAVGPEGTAADIAALAAERAEAMLSITPDDEGGGTTIRLPARGDEGKG